MTEKEFKKLNRGDLLDIIFQLQEELEKQQEKNRMLEQELEDKRILIDNAGSLAEVAASIGGLYAAVQKTADIYLKEIQRRKKELEEKDRQTGSGQGQEASVK